MTDTKTNLTSDLEVLVTANPTVGAKRIQTTKRHLIAVDEDLNTLRAKEVETWTDREIADLKELSPAEEAEMNEPQIGYEAEIEALDEKAVERASNILARLETYIPILNAIKEGGTIVNLNIEGLYTIDEDFKKAAEEADTLAEYIGDYQAMIEEMFPDPDKDKASDEGPHGRNK